MKRRILLVLVLSLAVVGAARADTVVTQEMTCPLCSHAFKCELDASGTRFGMRLDLKPVGPIAAPWRLPVCPKCHFVIYDEHIPAEEIEKCREIVPSQTYKKHIGRASHYLLGILFEGLQKPSMNLAHIFLKASWQEEQDPVKLKDCLERSLRHFEVFLQKNTKKEGGTPSRNLDGDESYSTALLLKGEILRRLGRFDEAKVHLTGVLKLKPFQGTLLGDIVAFEIMLCDKKDSKPHEVSEVEKAKEAAPVEELEDVKKP